MSYGIQCLSSDIPENREVVGDAALLFRNKDVDDLERQLAAALSNVAAGTQRASAGRQRVETLFSWERVVDQLEALYERAASGLRSANSDNRMQKSTPEAGPLTT